MFVDCLECFDCRLSGVIQKLLDGTLDKSEKRNLKCIYLNEIFHFFFATVIHLIKTNVRITFLLM